MCQSQSTMGSIPKAAPRASVACRMLQCPGIQFHALALGLSPGAAGRGSSRTVCRTPGLCICSINLNSGHLHKGSEHSLARDVLAGPMEMSMVSRSMELFMFPESMDVHVLWYPHSSISQDPPSLFCPKPSVLFCCHHECPSEAAGSQPTSLGRVTALRLGWVILWCHSPCLGTDTSAAPQTTGAFPVPELGFSSGTVSRLCCQPA